MRERPPGGAVTSVPPEDLAWDEGPMARPLVPDDAPAHALIGHVVGGRFRLVGVLGEGGLGATFAAEELERGSRVALKVLTEVAVRDPEAGARFVRDARAATSIASEHVVKVSDVGEDPDIGLYVAMELVAGEDLGARIARRGKLRAEEAVVIASQIALALDAAHHQGVIHRDLKPQNVLVGKAPDGKPVVKVVDFGVAKLARDTRRSSRSAITRSGMAVGTPQYMSPEQAQVMIVDARADVYALGAVVYEMLVGVPPVPVLPYEQTIVHIVLKGAARLLPGPAVPAALAKLVNEMLASRKDDRPGSAGEVYTRLQALARELGLADAVPAAPVRALETPAGSEVEVGETEGPRSRGPLRRRSTRGPRERRSLREGAATPGAATVEEAAPVTAPPDEPVRTETPEADEGDRASVVEPLVGRTPLLVVAASLGLLLVVLGAREIVSRRRAVPVAEAATAMTSWPTAAGAPAVTTAPPTPTASTPAVASAPSSPAPSVSAVASAAPEAAPPKSTGSRIGDARIALERGETARAIALAKDALATDPHRGEAWLILGAAHEMAGRTAEARAAYTECAEHGRGHARAECADLLTR